MKSGLALVSGLTLWAASLLAPLLHVHSATEHEYEQVASHQHGTEVHAHFPLEQAPRHEQDHESWSEESDSHDAKPLNLFLFGETNPPVQALPTEGAHVFKAVLEVALTEFPEDAPARDPPALKSSPPRAPPA